MSSLNLNLRRIVRPAASLSVVLLGGFLFAALNAGAATAKVDVVAAASLSVRVDSIKATSAIIAWFNDRYNYGSRTMCYAVAPASPTGNCVVKTAKSDTGSFTLKNLTLGTKYNFNINAINTRDTQDPPYATGGDFTTLADSSVSIRFNSVPAGQAGHAAGTGEAYDVRGRALHETGHAPVLAPRGARNPSAESGRDAK